MLNSSKMSAIKSTHGKIEIRHFKYCDVKHIWRDKWTNESPWYIFVGAHQKLAALGNVAARLNTKSWATIYKAPICSGVCFTALDKCSPYSPSPAWQYPEKGSESCRSGAGHFLLSAGHPQPTIFLYRLSATAGGIIQCFILRRLSNEHILILHQKTLLLFASQG